VEEILKFTVMCALESGKIQRDHYRKGFAIHHKGETNLVTDVDIACQKRIIERIRERFPEDRVIAEEQENVYEGRENRWIIDPLDGTTNYAHGYPFFGTSIAYEKDGEVYLGVVYNPIFQELFYGTKGGGAYFNHERIFVSAMADLRSSLLSTGFPYDLPTSKKNNIKNFLNFLYEAQAIRRDGSAALNLCYVACGRFDGHWEMKLNPWDVAAGTLILTEAGGSVTDIEGKPFSIYGEGIVASNGIIHADMLRVLKGGG
jgi:myo-inositol-1(or 4)-monophosphatase